MKSLTEISVERDTLATVTELTTAFEGIASMHIAQIKDQVLNSQSFFGELWQVYRQIRVDEKFHFGRTQGAKQGQKELIILVTTEGSFSGDLDQRVVVAATSFYNKDKHDIIVVGSHGASQLAQSGIPYVRSFRLPVSDRYINVLPLANELQNYKNTTVFYPSYVSLSRQEVRSIQMSAWVAERGEGVAESQDAISEASYIFEPSTFAVIDHLERSMIVIMLGEIIMESKLAQYASRYRAMTAAKDKANDSFNQATLGFNRTKRLIKDERAKEILNGMRKAKAK